MSSVTQYSGIIADYADSTYGSEGTQRINDLYHKFVGTGNTPNITYNYPTLHHEGIDSNLDFIKTIISNIRTKINNHVIDTIYFSLTTTYNNIVTFEDRPAYAADINYIFDYGNGEYTATGSGSSSDPAVITNGAAKYIDTHACLHYSAAYTSHYTAHWNNGAGHYTSHYTSHWNNGAGHYTSHYTAHYKKNGNGHYTAHFTSHWLVDGTAHLTSHYRSHHSSHYQPSHYSSHYSSHCDG